MIRVHVTIVLFHPDLDEVAVLLSGLTSIDTETAVAIHVNDDDGRTAAAIRDMADARGAFFDVTSSEQNLGFSGGHNQLLARAFRAGADLVVVHNPDLTLAPEAIGALMAEAARHPDRLLGPALERAQPGGQPTGLVDSLGIRWTIDARHLDVGQGRPFTVSTAQRPWRVEGISGACLAVTRAVYDRIVGASGEFFDEDFIAYREDAELALRAQLLGVESWLVPAARGRHVRSQRGTVRGHNAQIDLLGVRNRFLIAFKWGRRRPGWWPAALVRDAVVIAAVLLRETSSRPGLTEAWQLRGVMRAKRRRVLAAVPSASHLTP